MRILFVHNLKAGGARRTMAEHMARVDGEVFELCLATATPVRDDAELVPLALHADALPPVLRPPARYTDLVATLRAWRIASRRVASIHPDVVVAHPCQFLQAPPAISARPQRTTYFCHEFRRVDHEAAADRRRALTRIPYAPLYAAERRADMTGTQAAAQLLTNSAYTAAGIERAYDRQARVLRLGVPAAFVPDAAGNPEPRHLLSVGSLIANKGHDLVIAGAGATARPRPVVIVAPGGDPGEDQRLHALAREHGVELSIRSGITDTELRDLYRGAFATLYMAVAEPYGLVSLEAQACGSPVIVSAEGGLPETLVEGATGWAVPRRAADVAQALERLEDEALRDRFARAAAAHGARYSWEESTRALEAAIGELLG